MLCDPGSCYHHPYMISAWNMIRMYALKLQIMADHANVIWIMQNPSSDSHHVDAYSHHIAIAVLQKVLQS